MKRLFMTGALIGSVFLLTGCQFETKAAPPMMKVGLYAPEKIAADTRTTVAVEIENPQDIDVVHVQVTPIGTEDTETFETKNKEGHYVSSIPFKKSGVYVVNGMVHVGEKVYTPKSLVQVGDVSEAELEKAQAMYQSQAPATHDGHGSHHH